MNYNFVPDFPNYILGFFICILMISNSTNVWAKKSNIDYSLKQQQQNYDETSYRQHDNCYNYSQKPCEQTRISYFDDDGLIDYFRIKNELKKDLDIVVFDGREMVFQQMLPAGEIMICDNDLKIGMTVKGYQNSEQAAREVLDGIPSWIYSFKVRKYAPNQIVITKANLVHTVSFFVRNDSKNILKISYINRWRHSICQTIQPGGLFPIIDARINNYLRIYSPDFCSRELTKIWITKKFCRSVCVITRQRRKCRKEKQQENFSSEWQYSSYIDTKYRP